MQESILIDRIVQAGARGFNCRILAYNVPLRQRRSFKAVIAAPSSYSARRVLKEELGVEWSYLDWNAG